MAWDGRLRVGVRMLPAMTGAPMFSSGTFTVTTYGPPATSRLAPSPMPGDVAAWAKIAVITRHDGTLTTTLEVLVSAEDDAEVRRSLDREFR